MQYTMRTLGMALAAAALSVSSTGIVWAANEAGAAHDQSTSAAEMRQMASGTIQSVDVASGKVVLKTGLLQTEEFRIKADTKINDGAQQLALINLKSGSEVDVQYVQQDGQKVAREIMLTTSADHS